MLSVIAAIALHAASTTLGLFDLTTSDPGLKTTAIDSVAAAIGALPGFKVLTRNELEAMIGAERMKTTMGCNDASCLAEIGAAAGVSRVVSGSVSVVDGAYVVNLQLVNVQYANVENRSTLTWHGSGAYLADVLGAAAELLVLPARDKKPGRLKVSGQPPDSTLVVDGEQKAVIGELAIGTHELRVDSPGFEPATIPFIIRHGRDRQLDVQMKRVAEQPLYKKWWFWTTIGAVAVAGGATAAYFALRPGGFSGQDQGVSFSVDNPVAR